MKAFFTAALIVFSLFIKAQEYNALLAPDKVWDVGYWDGNNFCEPYGVGAYFVGADTVWNGKTYSKIMSYRLETVSHYGPGDICVKRGTDTTSSFFTNILMREEVANKRVYRVDLGADIPEETLLYDFGLEVGDSIQTENFGALTVTEIDSLSMYNGEYRKRYKLSNFYEYTESVGGLDGLFSDLGSGIGASNMLFCVHGKSDIYELYFGGNCHPLVAGVEDNLNQQKVKVFPNPAFEVLSIEGMSEGDKLQIIDVLGNEIGVKLVDESMQISIAELEPGTYVLKDNTGSVLFVKAN